MPQGTLQAAINLTSAMAWILITTGAIILGTELPLLLIYAIRKKGKEKIIKTAKFWTPLGIMALIFGFAIVLFLTRFIRGYN